MKIAILAQFSSKFSAIFPKKNVQFLPQFSVGLTYRLPQTCRSACLTPASVLHHLNILYHDCQRCQLHLFSTAQPCQDGGTLVFVSSPSTSDTDRSGTRRDVLPLSAVCDLGVYVDADVTMSVHVTTTVRACFAALRQIRIVRRSLTQDALLTLIRSLVITKLDFCCSALAGVSGLLMQWLQYSLC